MSHKRIHDWSERLGLVYPFDREDIEKRFELISYTWQSEPYAHGDRYTDRWRKEIDLALQARNGLLSCTKEDIFEALSEQPREAKVAEFYTCFISYSHADKAFSRRLHDQLRARSIRCWLDEHDLKPGDRILDVVNDAIHLHDKILLCCSETSLESWWVIDEVRKAQERERRDGHDIIIPLMVDRYLLEGWEDGLAADLRSRLAADFTGWEHDNAKFEEQFERVVVALRTDETSLRKAPESKL